MPLEQRADTDTVAINGQRLALYCCWVAILGPLFFCFAIELPGTVAMAIAVLVSSSAEAERFTAYGLDLASRLQQPAVFICIKPAKSSDVEERRNNSGDNDSVPKEKSQRLSETPESESPQPDFLTGSSYVDQTNEHIAAHLGRQIYGFVPTEVVELPGSVDAIRTWTESQHASDRLGYYSIDLLFIPLIRGAGLENARESKGMLFESVTCDGVMLWR